MPHSNRHYAPTFRRDPMHKLGFGKHHANLNPYYGGMYAAPVMAAPLVHAAPVVHAAPLYSHGLATHGHTVGHHDYLLSGHHLGSTHLAAPLTHHVDAFASHCAPSVSHIDTLSHCAPAVSHFDSFAHCAPAVSHHVDAFASHCAPAVSHHVDAFASHCAPATTHHVDAFASHCAPAVSHVDTHFSHGFDHHHGGLSHHGHGGCGHC